MRRKLLFFALMLGAKVFAQVPAGYYDEANGLTGYDLKSKLSEIISRNYKDNGYGGLWETYKTSDIDNYYEKDGTIIDIYSENPQGQDPYDFTVGVEQCGASGYKKEGDCYNREHIIPQSAFSQKSPMRNDAHFVLPTDGFVNQRRNRLPFGEVNNPIETFKNGSKIGVNNTAGYGGQVFEPIDEFKGDLARTILYFATRYENEIPTFRKDDIQDGHNQSILDGTKNQSITKWQLDILLKWHNQDPVSQKERDRNDAIYKRQNNRNPYIDNPEWANVVWNYQPPVSTPDTIAPTAPARLTLGEITENSVALTWDASTDNKGVTVYEVYVNGQLKTTSATPSAVVNGLTPDTLYSFYIIAKDAAGNSSEKSNIVEARTKPTSGTNPTPPTSTPSCGTEDFEKIPSAQSNYAERVWENNGITWTATKAQTQNKNGQSRVITINVGTLTSAGIRDGVGAISVKTHLPYKETTGIIRVKVNGVEKETLNITKNWTQHTINDINAEGTAEIQLEIVSGRISLDDLSWTCYTTPDTEAPSVPTLSAGEITTNTVELNWTPSTDNVAVKHYEIYANGTLVSTIPAGTHSAVIPNLTENTPYTFYIIAKDEAGNTSAKSNILDIITAKKLVTNEDVRTKRVQVFPNPVMQNGDLLFKNIGQNQNVKIYTMSGRLIKEVASVSEDETINIGNVAKGVYMIVTRDQAIRFVVK